MARVLLVGDRPVVLAGLRSHLAHEDFSVAEVAPPGSRTLEPITELRPDVVLVDCSATREAFLLCYRLKQLARPQRVVLHLTDSTPQLLVAAWVAGASGLASPATSRASLIETVCLAASGRRTLPRPPIAAVRAAGRQLAPVDLSIFGMRMHDVPSDEISTALRLDPLEVDGRVRALVRCLSRDQGPGGLANFKVALSFDHHHGPDANPRSRRRAGGARGDRPRAPPRGPRRRVGRGRGRRVGGS